MIKLHKCPLCASPDIQTHIETRDYFLSGEAFNIDRCRSCGFLFTNPRPEDKDLGKYYESEEYLSHDTRVGGLKDLLYGTVKKVAIRQKVKLVEKYSGKKQARILDYGCGIGSLLHEFKKNDWDTTGIEPNEKAAAFARKQYDLKISPDVSGIDDAQKFDVIMLWHVIEHLPLLHDTIEELKQKLSENGTMFIAFPNIESPDAVKYGKYWAALDVPRHLHHFSKATFSNFIGKHGFEIRHILPMKFDSFYVSLLSEQYRNGGLLSWPKAFMAGYASNRKAKEEVNYSSLIFVLK